MKSIAGNFGKFGRATLHSHGAEWRPLEGIVMFIRR